MNGVELTYDEVGNVLTYGNKEYTWNTGRNLERIVDNENEYNYTYDENGIRTSKTVNGVTTYYNTKNGVILSQSDGTNTMYFQYDTNGIPLGFIYNGTQYFYMTNQMGDVIGITDASGLIVGNYEYDAWGAVTFTDSNIANLNPIRYRGYYYDAETGYYYLQSRYYDSSICRLINADIPEIAQVSKGIPAGTNLFAYCNNDSVNNIDTDGYWAEKLIYNIKDNAYDVNVRWKFLSKQYCLSFARDLIKNADRITSRGRSRIKGIWFGMTAHRMAVEIWFHAMVYYGGYPLAKICNKFRTSIWDRANPITVNSNDKRAPYFYTAWYAAATVKRLLLCSHIPKLVKIAAAIVL